MSPLARVLIGVALGSCFTLFLHRDSRPFMTGLVPRPTDAQAIREASSPPAAAMHVPVSTAEAGLWMELGSERMLSGRKLSQEELHSLSGLAQFMERWKQPDQYNNAFWHQMAAVFLNQLGDKQAARNEWEQASKCNLWRDYQAALLLNDADMMGRTHGSMAWQLAGLYYQRRVAVGEVIEDFARDLLKGVGEVSKDDVDLRYTTLVNAHLITQGAQSVAMLRYAVGISTLSVQPPDEPPISSTDKHWRERLAKARGRFQDALNQLGMRSQADMTRSYFGETEAHTVMTMSFRPAQTAAQISAFSVLTATLPGSLLVVGLIGAVIWPLGLLALRFSNDHTTFSWPPALIFGGVLGISAMWLTFLPLAGVVALLCALFLAFTPKNERSRLPSDLGGVFSWTVGLLSALFAVAIVGFLASLSTPAKVLFPYILQSDPTQVAARLSVLLAGLAMIMFALLLLIAPMWAFAKRVRTPFVLGLAFKTFGMVLLIVGLAGTVVLAPICVYADSTARSTMKQLVGNEPEHYINIFS